MVRKNLVYIPIVYWECPADNIKLSKNLFIQSECNRHYLWDWLEIRLALVTDQQIAGGRLDSNGTDSGKAPQSRIKSVP